MVNSSKAMCRITLYFEIPRRFVTDSELTIVKRQCIKNLTAVLEAAGSSIDKVVKVNVFLGDMDDFAKMNEEYIKHWGDTPPSRT
jgi:enamine deaminase RidA (YjgF/YER057c/UK114 family)